MSYKLLPVFLVLMVATAIGDFADDRVLRMGLQTNSPIERNGDSLDSDAEVSDIRKSLEQLSSGEYVEIEKARMRLLAYANKSSAGRKEVIRILVDNMDKPNLDLETQRSNYFLWREGSRLLGDLKATEALDLLISHLDLTNGLHSTSMVFQPAIAGVLGIGSAAIPKLEAALRESPNRNIRMASAYCLTSIGGALAMNALKQARGSESDKCISRFIRLSLSTFSYKSGSGHLLFDNHAPQADIDARRNWFTAFQCIE